MLKQCQRIGYPKLGKEERIHYQENIESSVLSMKTLTLSLCVAKINQYSQCCGAARMGARSDDVRNYVYGAHNVFVKSL